MTNPQSLRESVTGNNRDASARGEKPGKGRVADHTLNEMENYRIRDAENA